MIIFTRYILKKIFSWRVAIIVSMRFFRVWRTLRWGIFGGAEQLLSDFNLKEGVSLVINNNCRADKLFYKIIDENIKTKKILLQKIIPFNLTIIKPVERPKSRDDIYKQVEKYGFVYTADKYCSIQKILPRIARYVPRRLKRMLKKFLRRWDIK